MPDPTLKTVSATQIAGIANRSQYDTRFELYHHFIGDVPIERQADERMTWGKRLQPVILGAVADHLRLEVIPNDAYLTNPTWPVGATIDGFCMDPQRGLGVVETKNVDKLVHLDQWSEQGGPDYVELQVATQLMVEHPEHGFPKWGIIAALVGGNDLKFYERKPEPELYNEIAGLASAFLNDVQERHEPEVAGVKSELPVLRKLFPETAEAKWLNAEDLDDPDQVTEWIRELHFFSGQGSMAKKQTESLQTRLMAVAGDAQFIRVPGWRLKISRWDVTEKITTLPDDVRNTLREHREWIVEAEDGYENESLDAIDAAIDFKIVKPGFPSQRFTIKEFPAEQPAEGEINGMIPAAEA